MKSGNSSQFQSEEFKSFFLEHGIEQHKSPPLWPQANGEVDKQNRTRLKALKVIHVREKGWKGELMKFMLAYRTTPQASMTPTFLVFGRELKTNLPNLRNNKSILYENVRDLDWNHKRITKAYADSRHGAVSNTMLPNQFLLKNTKTSGKRSTNVEQTSYKLSRLRTS